MPQQNTINPFGPIQRTTGATLTQVSYYTPLPSRMYLITVHITALNETLTEGAAYIRRASYIVNAAGVIVLVGSVTDVYTAESAGAWDATLDISSAITGAAAGTGPYIRAMITGAALTNIVWKADWNINEVALGSQSTGA